VTEQPPPAVDAPHVPAARTYERKPGPIDVEPRDPEATQPLPPPMPRPHPVIRPPLKLIAALAAGVVIAGAVLGLLVQRMDREPAGGDAAPTTFATPQALVSYLGERGLVCTGYESVQTGQDGGRGRCVAGGADVAVGVYAAASDVEALWAAAAGTGHPVAMALGQNWTVNGPADWTRRVADVMNVQYRARM
jgi:hypothetical protein